MHSKTHPHSQPVTPEDKGDFEVAEVPPSYDGPLEHLAIVRMRPAFESATRRMLVAVRRLPATAPGAAG